jgi:hypothetical protein
VGELITVRQLGRRERTVRVGQVNCETPMLYPVSSSVDQRLSGFRLTLDVNPRWRWARTVSVFIRVCLDDHGATAVRLETDSAEPFSADGLREPCFGWFFGNFDQRTGLGTRYIVRAVIETPADLATLSGVVRVDASIARGRLRKRTDHATLRSPVTFVLRPDAILSTPAVRLCVAADIEKSSRFRGPDAAIVQERFAFVMAEARKRTGVDAAQVGLQRSGDGQVAVFPPAIDESRVIPLFVAGLTEALSQANAARRPTDKIRIRVALDRGHIEWGANGWIGDPPVAVQRLLDSDAARGALADNPEQDFALIVSEVVYRDVIAAGYGNLPSQTFRLADIDIPTKNFARPAWIYVPPGPG